MVTRERETSMTCAIYEHTRRSTEMKVAVPLFLVFLCTHAARRWPPRQRSRRSRTSSSCWPMIWALTASVPTAATPTDATHRRTRGIRPAFKTCYAAPPVRAVPDSIADRALCLSHRRTDERIVACRRAWPSRPTKSPCQAPQAGRLCHGACGQMAAVGSVAGRLGF